MVQRQGGDNNCGVWVCQWALAVALGCAWAARFRGEGGDDLPPPLMDEVLIIYERQSRGHAHPHFVRPAAAQGAAPAPSASEQQPDVIQIHAARVFSLLD